MCCGNPRRGMPLRGRSVFFLPCWYNSTRRDSRCTLDVPRWIDWPSRRNSAKPPPRDQNLLNFALFWYDCTCLEHLTPPVVVCLAVKSRGSNNCNPYNASPEFHLLSVLLWSFCLNGLASLFIVHVPSCHSCITLTFEIQVRNHFLHSTEDIKLLFTGISRYWACPSHLCAS